MAELAKKAGTSAAQVSRLEKGERTLTKKWAERLAPHLGCTAQEILFGKAGLGQLSPVQTPSPPSGLPYVDISTPERQSMPPDVPVMGTAIGGNEGKFVYESGVVDYARRLPGIAKAKDVFCLNVQGDSMSPRYQEGELIFLNPHLPARVGDDVVIEFHPNKQDEHVQGCLKRLRKRTASKIVVEQFNPPGELEFGATSVKAVHRVLTLRELMGV